MTKTFILLTDIIAIIFVIVMAYIWYVGSWDELLSGISEYVVILVGRSLDCIIGGFRII